MASLRASDMDRMSGIFIIRCKAYLQLDYHYECAAMLGLHQLLLPGGEDRLRLPSSGAQEP